MNLLVIGGAGYIGSGVLLKLAEEFPDATITSMDNLERGDYRHVHHLRKERRYRLLVGDVRKMSDLRKALIQDTMAVIHLAAVPGMEKCQNNPENAISTNLYGTCNVLEAARKHDVERFVFSSSAAVFGTPITTHP